MSLFEKMCSNPDHQLYERFDLKCQLKDSKRDSKREKAPASTSSKKASLLKFVSSLPTLSFPRLPFILDQLLMPVIQGNSDLSPPAHLFPNILQT